MISDQNLQWTCSVSPTALPKSNPLIHLHRPNQTLQWNCFFFPESTTSFNEHAVGSPLWACRTGRMGWRRAPVRVRTLGVLKNVAVVGHWTGGTASKTHSAPCITKHAFMPCHVIVHHMLCSFITWKWLKLGPMEPFLVLCRLASSERTRYTRL